jgi:hypothetical protein
VYKRNVFLLYVLFTLIISLNSHAVFGGVVTLSWNAPTTDADGTPLTDLAGYKVSYGNTSRNYSQKIDVGNVTTYTANLSDGTYYFAVKAYDTSGNESAYSNEISKTIQTIQQYTLNITNAGTGTGTVISSPVGINCGSDCTEPYNAGTVITLTASSGGGSTFAGWSGGGCNGIGQCVITMNKDLTVSASFTTNGNVTVYEDAEDGTIKGWDVYDNDPVGANITNVYDNDRMSRVIQLIGSGWDNGYRLREDDLSVWNNSTQFIIEWSMKYSEYFTIYIDVETTKGHRYIYYTPDNYNNLGTGEYVQHSLGSGVVDGKWHTFASDLQADLQEAQPGVTILTVNGFLIRGSGRVDDIKLR